MSPGRYWPKSKVAPAETGIADINAVDQHLDVIGVGAAHENAGGAARPPACTTFSPGIFSHLGKGLMTLGGDVRCGHHGHTAGDLFCRRGDTRRGDDHRFRQRIAAADAVGIGRRLRIGAAGKGGKAKSESDGTIEKDDAWHSPVSGSGAGRQKPDIDRYKDIPGPRDDSNNAASTVTRGPRLPRPETGRRREARSSWPGSPLFAPPSQGFSLVAFGQSLAGHSCGGSRGLQPRSLSIPFGNLAQGNPYPKPGPGQWRSRRPLPKHLICLDARRAVNSPAASSIA